MDTLFLTLMIFSIITAALAVMALIESVIISITKSKWWREMPRGSMPMYIVSALSVMGAGALTGLLLYCVFAVLGWGGIIASLTLGLVQWACASYIEHKETCRPPMATRRPV